MSDSNEMSEMAVLLKSFQVAVNTNLPLSQMRTVQETVFDKFEQIFSRPIEDVDIETHGPRPAPIGRGPEAAEREYPRVGGK